MGKSMLGGIVLGVFVSLGLAVLVSVLVPVHRPLQATIDAPQDASEPAAPQMPAVEAPLATSQSAAVTTPVQPQVAEAPYVAEQAAESTESAALPGVGDASNLAEPTATPKVSRPEATVETAVTAPAQAPQIAQETSEGTADTVMQSQTAQQPQVGAAEPLVDPVDSAETRGASVQADTPVIGATPPETPQLDTADADAPRTPQPTFPQPQVGNADELPEPTTLPAAKQTRVTEDAPVLPNPQALAPMEPSDGSSGTIDTAPAEAPVKVAQAPDPEPATPADGPAGQAATNPPTQTAKIVPVTPRLGKPARSLVSNEQINDGVRINRAIGAQSTQQDDAVTVAVPQTTIDAAVANEPPIKQFAEGYEDPAEKPLMSIVLIDAGVDLASDEIGPLALTNFPYPLTVAIDASLPDAGERMALYRKEGFEVLAMINLPQGAQATDAEVSLSVALDRLPQVVGVIEGTGEGLQGSREVADQVTAILAQSGHGLVTQSQGLNTMPKLAVKRGVPAAPVFRDFDSKSQQARVIRRFLDQAAFKARQEGGVILLGRMQPESIKALLVWALAERAEKVALVPVSAVLSQ